MVTGDVKKLPAGKAFYTLLCYPAGGAVDDLLVYCLDKDRYMMIVNASNIDKDFAWLEKHKAGDLKMENLSADYAILAVQGPESPKILDGLLDKPVSGLASFAIAQNAFKGRELLAARTGYTGEDGFEITVKNEAAGDLWDALVKAGVLPCGLGARDTLRLEMGYTLYGHEINEKTNVLEAGLGWIVDLSRPDDFMGKRALLESKQKGLPRKLVGLLCEDKGIPRAACQVYKGNTCIGAITSGGHSPVLNKGVALAFIGTKDAALNDLVEIDVRGRRLAARVVKRKFLDGK
jgi:aminomethyltransferase